MRSNPIPRICPTPDSRGHQDKRLLTFLGFVYDLFSTCALNPCKRKVLNKMTRYQQSDVNLECVYHKRIGCAKHIIVMRIK